MAPKFIVLKLLWKKREQNNKYSIPENLSLEIFLLKGKNKLASPLFVLESNNNNVTLLI